MELLYVVVPVYKVESYIHRCIDSILNQTYRNYQLILVDDGSPDNCPAICDEYAKQDSRIHVIHQENGGLSAARNTGIEYALERGTPENHWITFIDSDDFVHPKYLEFLFRAATETGSDISICSFVKTTLSETEDSVSFVDPECLSPEDLWCRHYGEALVAWGKMYRLFLFSDIMYPVGKLNEDEFTTYKLLFQCDKISFLPLRMYYYYQNSTSIMHSSWTPRRLDGQEALHEQVLFFMENGYHRALRITMYYLIKRQIVDLRAMEINHYDKTARKALKKDMYATLYAYAKDFSVSEAFDIWFSLRIMHRIKKVINRNFFKRAFTKIKRLLKR